MAQEQSSLKKTSIFYRKGLPFIKLVIAGKKRTALVDTGSSFNIIDYRLVDNDRFVRSKKTCEFITYEKKSKKYFVTDKLKEFSSCVEADLSFINADLVVGVPYLKKNKIILEFK